MFRGGQTGRREALLGRWFRDGVDCRVDHGTLVDRDRKRKGRRGD